MRRLDPARKGRLSGETVFLSGSVPTRPAFERVPDAPFVIEQAVVSLARAVFAEDGRMVFGAHPSISPLVSAIASEYLAASPASVARPVATAEADQPVIIYQSQAFAEVLPDETWDMVRFGFARLVWTEARDGEHYRRGQAASLICPRSLTHMRERMIGETQPRTMVVVGGMEGVFEEVDIFRSMERNPKPGAIRIYAAGGTGGAAAQLITRQRGAPLLRSLEREWGEASGAPPSSEISTQDPRYRPAPPYGAMMQWLAGDIARTRDRNT